MSFGSAVNLFMAYKFIKNLVLPFRRWDAHRTGVIDENGSILVPKDKRTQAQKNSFGYFDLITLNLKRLMGRLPGGKSAIASYAAALLLLREYGKINEDNVEAYVENLEEHFDKYMREATILIEEQGAPTVNVGGGQIAGVGVGPKGEPGLTLKQRLRYKKKNKETKGTQSRKLISMDIVP
jgi:hypothetical protein